MSRQKVLVVGVLNIADNNAASCDESVILAAGVEVDAISDFTAVSDRMVQLCLRSFRRVSKLLRS